MRRRVRILNGVNLDQLGRRDPEHYGNLTIRDLELQVGRFARDLDLHVSFEQTNHEGEFCGWLHDTSEMADGVVINPGAWTHYSWAIRDALEICSVPAVEVHLSAVDEREEWRRVSVVRDLCIGTVQGEGVDGYRRALQLLKEAFGE